jgi:hypothetical protein
MRKPLLLLTVAFVSAGVARSGDERAASYTNSIGMKMVRIEPGTFPMGSQLSRDHWTEQPVHSVTISRSFSIAETEVTAEQFRRFRREFEGTPGYAPYAAGVSWHEASAFAAWLSRKERRSYRLPTEAEWEYVARAGGDDAAAQARGRVDAANAWGVKNMLAGAREWCLDWFDDYPATAQVDPVGPERGSVRVVRGGRLDLEERNFLKKDFGRPQSRLAIAPSFGVPVAARTPGSGGKGPARGGLVGVWFAKTDLTDPQEAIVITRLTNNWNNDPRGGGRWSARWAGQIVAPHSGEVTFTVDTDAPFRLEIDGRTVIDSWTSRAPGSGTATMKKDHPHAIALTFARAAGGDEFHLSWAWPGHARALVPDDAVSHTGEQARTAAAGSTRSDAPGLHAIGFRLVEGEMPKTPPTRVEPALWAAGVKQDTPNVANGPDLAQPYFRKRHLLPMPPDNAAAEVIDALGFHPSFRPHNHSPGLAVLPNGDVLMVIYTSYREYEPGVSIVASRLRFGAESWDPPTRLADFVGMNDHAPLLWNDGGALHLFWGSPKLEEGGFPFQWMTSKDNGATWGEIRFPRFVGPIGSHSRQPINSAFRDDAGRMYVSSDGSGGESVLWASDDDGATWFDTGGRSAGRHTSYAPLKDGRILGMGGKNTQIDGFMPKAISSDRGRTWTVSKTPFTWQGTNQRPTLIRLKSGRLFFAGDFIHHGTGAQPKGVTHVGSYVALSDDEGETWRIKRLVGAQLHEAPERAERMKGPTLGYAVARQAPNGLIHLVATMNNPCLHFELNEAWILDGDASERPDSELMASRATRILEVKTFEERYPDGKPKATWAGGVADDGRFLLHGGETWYHEDGSKQWEVTYDLGRKRGLETYWSREGRRLWSWDHRADGTSTWTRWWPSGQKKAESTWRGLEADGVARRWDADGTLAAEMSFDTGRAVPARSARAE